MKDKILAKLKAGNTKFANVSDRTLEAFAVRMANGVTDESLIDGIVAAELPVLEAMQGQYNHDIAEALKNQTPPTPPVVPPVVPPVTPPAFDMEKMLEKMGELVEAKFAPINAEKQKAEVLAGVKVAISEKFQLDESDQAMSDYILGQVTSGEVKDVDSVVQNYEAKYNEFRTINGQGAIAPKVVKSVDGKTEEDPYAARIREQRAEADRQKEAANKRVNGIQ
jgi:hypothetical protein